MTGYVSVTVQGDKKNKTFTDVIYGRSLGLLTAIHFSHTLPLYRVRQIHKP